MSEELIRSLPIWKSAVEIAPLGGGITNLNYRVDDGEARYAARAGHDDPKLGISRRNEAECVRVAADLGIAPAMVYRAPGVMVCDFADGTPLTIELLSDRARVERVASVVRDIHSAGAEVTGHLAFFSPFQVARTYVAWARAEGLALPTDDPDQLLDEVRDLQARIAPFVPTFCHNDLMPGNLLDTGDRVWVIDWEYGGIGHPLFDLAGLSSNGDFDEDRDVALLEAYGETEDPSGGQFRIMKAMAALRESLWAVVQGSQSEIDFDYGEYRDVSYRKYRAALARV